MKSFIVKVQMFLTVLITVLISLFLSYRYLANFKLNDKNSDSILIVGHSHPECAYNDSLIMNTVNFAESGESYFYTYVKVKKLIEQNPEIQTVLIEFTNNQIDYGMNEWIWNDENVNYRFPKYGAFMDAESYLLLLNHNPETLINSSKVLMKNSLKNIFTGFKFQDGIGGFLYLDKNLADSVSTKSPVKAKKAKKSGNEVSKYNIKYLRETIDYLRYEKKDVFLVRSPQHKSYKGYRNEKQFQEILQAQFSDLEFLDFSNFPLPDSEFADYEHLNYKGAKKYSIWFNDLLKEGFLKQTNKQVIIENKMTF